MKSRPLLQILHISDLHYANDVRQKHQAARVRSRLHKMARRMPGLESLLSKIEKGLSGHDDDAFVFFEMILPELTLNDPDWCNIPSLMLATGDFTTWGNQNDIADRLSWLESICKKHNLDLVSIYGNHDVWPDKFPLFSRRINLESNRTKLRTTLFKDDWPINHRNFRFPAQPGQIELWSVNSVLHERIQNTIAEGNLDSDWYWQSGRRGVAQPRSIASRLVSSGPGNFRILASHHPFFDPNGAPYFGRGMVLTNAKTANQQVENGSHPPNFTVFLSGHTHQIHPSTLPPSLPSSHLSQSDLNDNQIQLITGTLSQKPYDPDAISNKSKNELGSDDDAEETEPELPDPLNAEDNQSFQVLRFYSDAHDASSLLLRRLLYVRAAGIGPFHLVNKANQHPPGEDIELPR